MDIVQIVLQDLVQIVNNDFKIAFGHFCVSSQDCSADDHNILKYFNEYFESSKTLAGYVFGMYASMSVGRQANAVLVRSFQIVLTITIL